MAEKASLSFYEVFLACRRALETGRGSFYPNKDFGSKLYASPLKCDEMLSAARQALCGIDGVWVKSVKLEADKAVFTVLINNTEKEVEISL